MTYTPNTEWWFRVDGKTRRSVKIWRLIKFWNSGRNRGDGRKENIPLPQAPTELLSAAPGTWFRARVRFDGFHKQQDKSKHILAWEMVQAVEDPTDPEVQRKAFVKMHKTVADDPGMWPLRSEK